MSRRARSLALGAIALLGVLGAWLAFAPSAAERDEPRDRETAERSSARAEAPDGDVARSAATATDLAAARARAESARRARRPLELLSIHGRLVLANGGVPRNGVVWLRGAGERLDFHDLFERLGGPAEWQRLTNSQELESRVRALGGFTPSWRAEAREDGSFDLHVPARAARFTFGAEADGAAYARAEAFDLSPARRDAPYVVVLDEAGALEGTVRDASGEAARHAWIALWPNGARLAGRVDFVERMRAEGDASGRFRFSALPPGSYQFAATADGCAPSSYDTVEVVAGAIARADIALPAGHEVSGRVTRGDGAPVEGALIRAWPSRGWVMLEAYGCARTDAQGRFRLGGLLPGPHSIDASREGLVTRKTEDTDAVAIPRPADAPPLAFVLDEGEELAGRVVDPKGAPLADAALLVTSDPSKTDRPKGWRGTWEHGTTEADGTFRIAGLGDAPWVVTATLDDVGTAKKEGVAAGTRDLEIVIAPAGIAGRAVDAATAKPIASFRAFARRSNQPTYQVPERLSETAFSSGDGRFEIRGLAPGRYFPFLEGDGYAETRGPEIEVKAGEIANAGDLKVDGASTLRGRVVEAANGEPVVNASVEAIHEGGNAMTRGVSAFTSADGTFEVRAVRTGRVRAVAWKENRAEAQSPIVEVRPGVVADAGVLALRAGGAIEGAALGAGGAPMAGGRAHAVFVSDASARPLRRSYVEAPLDDDGSFRLDGLAAGAWDVTAQPRAADDDRLKSVQRAIHATATVEEGRTTRIEFPLSPSGGCLVRGRVVRAGNGVAGVGVRIELDAPDGRRKRDAERDLSASTDKDGRFSIEHVPAGSGQAVMGTSRGIGDFTTHRQKLTIPDAPETEIELVLPTEATIAGRVTTTGDERPLADIPISAWQSGAGGSSSHAMRTTNPDGGYRIAGVPPGRYRVTAGGPAVYVAGGSDSPSEDFSTDSKEVDVADGATATLDFALEVGARAIVEVVSHDGTPVAHSVVSLIPIGEGGAKKMACGGVTNDLGVARVRGVPPGTWAARAESGAIPFAQSDPQGVALAAETRFRLQLKRGVAVRVRAVDAADAPVPVGSVTLYSGGAQVGHGWPKGGNEAAEIELVPGRYAIQVNAADDRAGVVEIEIGDSPPKEVVVKVAAPDKKPG